MTVFMGIIDVARGLGEEARNQLNGKWELALWLGPMFYDDEN